MISGIGPDTAHCDYIDNLSPSLWLLARLELRFVNSPKLCKVKKICPIASHLDGVQPPILVSECLASSHGNKKVVPPISCIVGPS